MNLRVLEVKIGDEVRPLLNTTNHTIRYTDGSPGFISSPPSGVTLEAALTEYVYGTIFGIKLVRPVFSPKPETEELITRIQASYPGVVIVGSTIQTQVYQRVFGMRPVLTAIPTGGKARLMRLDEFSTYAGRCSACGRGVEEVFKKGLVS